MSKLNSNCVSNFLGIITFIFVKDEVFNNLNLEITNESKAQFVSRLKNFERIRYHGKVSVEDEIYQEAAKEAKIIIREKPLLNGRFELLFYHNEKALSVSFHRYGNLGIRALNH